MYLPNIKYPFTFVYGYFIELLNSFNIRNNIANTGHKYKNIYEFK